MVFATFWLSRGVPVGQGGFPEPQFLHTFAVLQRSCGPGLRLLMLSFGNALAVLQRSCGPGWVSCQRAKKHPPCHKRGFTKKVRPGPIFLCSHSLGRGPIEPSSVLTSFSHFHAFTFQHCVTWRSLHEYPTSFCGVEFGGVRALVERQVRFSKTPKMF